MVLIVRSASSASCPGRESSAVAPDLEPAEDLLGTEWTHPYTREEAAYPVPELRRDKYWVPVSRIDQAYGDRHLVCTCPPLETYQDAAE